VEAHSNFQYARRLKISDTSTTLGLAALLLKRMNTSQAVDYYLDVQEKDPENKIAKNALDIIRKNSSTEALGEWLTPERLSKLYPPIPAPSISKTVIINGILVFCAVCVLTLGFLVKFNVIPNPFPKPQTRPTKENFLLSSQERSESPQTGGAYRFILTRNEAVELYEKALSLFNEYLDEGAKINLNRILESNAADGIKNKAKQLKMFIMEEVPRFDSKSFERGYNPAYSEVTKDPSLLALYSDVYVIWRGMATNVEVTDEGTRFDFLVGYDTRRTLEGIVPVFFDVPVSVNPERPIEQLLGKIVVSPSFTNISLEGVAIHQSGRLETEN
jgi:tetratricopeptide (TPR) repeat protein